MARTLTAQGGRTGAPDAGGAYAAARRHSRRVQVLKIALPGSAVMVLGAFAFWSWLATPPDTGVSADGAAFTDGKLVMANPKLDGFTKDNLPYLMTAARAIQTVKAMDVISLEEIDARLPVAEGNTATITSKGGTYDRSLNTLDFTSPLKVTTTDGMTALLKNAFMDMAAGSLATKEPVDITMKGAHITADSMTITEQGKVMVFEQRVKMTIEPGKLKAEPAKEAANGAN